ncbi:preprotein translocase subunit SecG [Candidatus Saccharibacteria bacterium]|nr:preprotein translocase subunit SecG [Candidatus Saccharibacteria bacterium]
MQIGSFLQATTLISAVLAILLILLQQRGASLGAGFGSSGELYTTRRGLEKSMFVATIVFVIIFVASILGLLLIPAE